MIEETEDIEDGEAVEEETVDLVDDGEDLLSEEAEAEFLAAVTIDEDRPNKDFLGLPALVWKYGCALSRATATLLQAKREFEYACARLRERAQRTLENDETVAASKVTVARVEALMKSQHEWLSARAIYDRALSRKALAGARLDALNTKANALQSYAASRRVEAKLMNSSVDD